jgi:hypothetical protein
MQKRQWENIREELSVRRPTNINDNSKTSTY